MIVSKEATIKYRGKYYCVPEEFIGKKVVVKKHGKCLDIICSEHLVITCEDRASSQKYTNNIARRGRGRIK